MAAGAEDYYAGRGESPGRWRGRGARLVGLVAGGRVERSGFMALMQGRSPVDGEVLREMGKRSTIAGLDLTFSAPKSVSVLFAVADDETSKTLLAAHERAVDAALGYLEREACFTRRGRDGAERLRGEGFIAASYRHRMSRAGDPQLHTHVVVGNLTRAEGRYTALDARALYEHKSAGGAIYRAVLRVEVRQRIPWVSWRPAGRGLFEIDGVSEEVLRHFSQRRVEIEERATELVGAAAGQLSRERMQGIALQTRRAKQYGISGGTWREQARARAAEHGLGSVELRALKLCSAVADSDPVGDRVADRLSGTVGLTEMHNTFVRRHAVAEIAGEFAQGGSVERVEQATSRYLGDETVRELAPTGEERRYTTVGLLTCERLIVEGAERRRSEQTALLPGEHVERVLSVWQPALNGDQTTAVRAITQSGDGVEAVTAVAGSGKTTMIGALAACYRQDGWEVVGAAPTGRAARQLRDTAWLDAETMHTLLLRLTRTGGFRSRTVLVLDEASMAPTRLTARLLEEAESASVKVIAVGDPGQLGSVQAGGWLAAITTDQQGPMLREAIRQQNASERDALHALHDGDPDTYLQHKQPEIAVYERELPGIETLVKQWAAARAQYGTGGAAMIARDNYTRELANRAARSWLRHTGQLVDAGVVVGGREYARGDRVVARRNDRHHDVDNGTLATVIEVSERTGAMIVQTDSGQPRALDPRYVAEHLEHAYALTAHGAQGGTFHWAGVIGRPEEFTREWAYTALSRARHQTTIHLIAFDRRVLLHNFELADFARKVVGVGSVGTRAWIALMLGRDGQDPLFLQMKEVGASVLEEYLGPSEFSNHGQRVVTGQRLMQAASDVFLGWLRVAAGIDGPARDFYGRQLRDWKGSAEIERMIPEGMTAYGRLCGWTLARAHARSGDRIAIAAYLGGGTSFDHAILEFSQAYAEQNRRDYNALTSAASSGTIAAQPGL